MTVPTVRVETSGEIATTIQYLLRYHGAADLEVDGYFGPVTEQAVKDFQTNNSLPADGVVGQRTWAALFVNVQQGDQGDAVLAVQSQLAARGYEIAVDGDFGPQTDGFVRDFQTEKSLIVDGIVGPQTWTALVATTPMASGSSPAPDIS